VSASGTAVAPIVFEPATAAHVVVTGADIVAPWRAEHGQDAGDRIYSTPWTYRFINYSPIFAHPDDDQHRLIGRAEQVVIDGYQLRQVLRRDELSRGTFFVDMPNSRLYVWAANNRELDTGRNGDSHVEASTRSTLWETKGAYVSVRGIQFRYAANQAQAGAVLLHGNGDEIEHCRFERMNSIGATFLAPDQVAAGCEFVDNGQMGWGANGADRLHMVNCLTEGNNTKGFDRGWEAGGNKTVLSRHVLLDHCRFVRNRGNGIWFDIGNEDAEVRNCLIADNEDAGIFYEISFGLHAHDNVITGNGFADNSGAWGAEAGICLSSSPGCMIERNLLVGNKEGFDFREQDRTTPRIGAPPGGREQPVWNHNETIRNNIIAYNRDAQTWGWFDTRDQRHWPRALQTGGRPPRSLPDLQIVFTDNVYATDGAQGLFNWGTAWLPHRYYSDLDSVSRELGLEQGSIVAPIVFRDFAAGDMRLAPGMTGLARECYPRGRVPGVTTE